MSVLNDIANVMPDPDTYDIRINNFQRAMLRKCLHHTLMTMPKDMWLNADERAVAESTLLMLTNVELNTDGINSFVL